MTALLDHDARRAVLADLGANGAVLDELLAYGAPPRLAWSLPPVLPLADEPFVAVWREYAAAATEHGATHALRERLVQLAFPVRSGMSRETAYLAATRSGEWPPSGEPGLALARPEAVHIELLPTIAGTLPALVVEERADFVALVQALAGRNEPIAVPPAMGACLVKGLANWDRVARHRARWESTAGPFADWSDELARLAAQKELYQDRLVVLSRGPYSAVAAAEASYAEAEWRQRSLALRAAHEATHYFTLRLFDGIRSHLVDELVADWAGCLRALGGYPRELALRFLGLEHYPRTREGGRLAVYRGALSDGAVEVLQALAVAAVAALAELAETKRAALASLDGLARWVFALARSTPEDLAAGDLARRLSPD